MEDDDEFGDLYTDVLKPFSSSIPGLQPKDASSSMPPAPNRPIGDNNFQSGDGDIPYGAASTKITGSNQTFNHIPVAATQMPKSDMGTDVTDVNPPRSTQRDTIEDVPVESNRSRIFNGDEFDLCTARNKRGASPDQKDGLESNTRAADEASGNKNGDFVLRSKNFGIEEEDDGGLGDLGSEPIIPGLDAGSSRHVVSNEAPENARKDDVSAEADDWDSDSEDDLQIVLNDNNHGAMGLDRSGMMGSDDEDDGDLVIVADDGAVHQSAEEQDFDENGAPMGDSEGKDTADGGKANGSAGVAQKSGYGNFAYHPFHSQFKYVRPGLPGATPGAPVGAAGQVRPPANVGSFGGRGRGEWRPAGLKGSPGMQKGFHPGFWGNSMSGRGLEFTLPSHKSIFDVDPDSFEEKPWKYPGVDISDFFNFGLNEESWKEYRKQLEQLRLESTMQSKIHVYESGRTEQEHDPDLPPELAAASGIHDPSAENMKNSKIVIGQSDSAKGTARVRPPIPIGRPIQVETGYGERLPSVDTRPPRMRDSDAVIEIVLQDAHGDDSSAGNEALDPQDDGIPVEDERTNLVEEDAMLENEYSDGCAQTYPGKKPGGIAKRSPSLNSVPDDIPAEEREKSLPPEAPTDNHPDSRGQSPASDLEKADGSDDERRAVSVDKAEGSPCLSEGESTLEKKSMDDQLEVSTESMERKRRLQTDSPAHTREQSFEEGTTPDEGPVPSNRTSRKDKAESTSKDSIKIQTTRKQKVTSLLESSAEKEADVSDVKPSRSSETSKATGSCRDHPKWREGVDEEVMQDGCRRHPGDLKRHRGEDGSSFRRKDREGRLEKERNYMLGKGRENSYERDWDPYAVHPLHARSESSDRRRERDHSDRTWQRQDEELYGRRIRVEDPRKYERLDEIVTRQRVKVSDSEKDDHLHSRKLLENGSWRGYPEKGVGLRYREKDDHLKTRFENMDDFHNKRRKEEELARRDLEKEELLHAHRESSSRHKRERDEVFDPRRRDDQSRRDIVDDYHSVRHKDDGWMQRERPDRPREKDEWHRPKQYYEDNLSRRDREDIRGASRGGRIMEEKTWASHSRTKEDYKGYDKYKETGRVGEQLKQKDRVEDESSLHYKGNEDAYAGGIQMNEEKRVRSERSNARSDRAAHASNNQRFHEKKQKENRKAKENDVSHHGSSGLSKKHQEDKSGRNDTAGVAGAGDLTAENRISSRHLPAGQGRDPSSDDEQKVSKRGRSKLEGWRSHKERDYDISNKTLPSLKVKRVEKISNGHSGISKHVQVESTKKVDDNTPAGGKDGGSAETKPAPAEKPDLDTVLKLKKRSERFKVPLPSEKDTTTSKKVETETPHSAPNETQANPEVKQERPPRKRRWVSN